mmetsp:Transcript_2692/g.4090  ORF Transcript_2692/g.4090 Transcript_2692/m.4090 type:complete len:214 (-) Transcript_2692:996-1637(-)
MFKFLPIMSAPASPNPTRINPAILDIVRIRSVVSIPSSFCLLLLLSPALRDKSFPSGFSLISRTSCIICSMGTITRLCTSFVKETMPSPNKMITKLVSKMPRMASSRTRPVISNTDVIECMKVASLTVMTSIASIRSSCILDLPSGTIVSFTKPSLRLKPEYVISMQSVLSTKRDSTNSQFSSSLLSSPSKRSILFSNTVVMANLFRYATSSV